MNYESIKQELINNEIYKKVKDYSKNRSDLKTYYNVGKMLVEDGKHYGEGIIKKYSERLLCEVGKGYSVRNLYNMKLFFEMFQKVQALPAKLSWTTICEVLPIKDNIKRKYYLSLATEQNLSYRELRSRIKLNEYERLDSKTKLKLKDDNKLEIQDLVKNPIILNNSFNREIIKEKALKELILEDMDNFLKQLGDGFAYIGNGYKIKENNRYNYIDLLLYNIEFNCYVVVELKVTKLKKEHIGQIMIYMNYIDENIKSSNQNKTIGIIMTKIGNEYVMKYCSDERIFNTTYLLEKA